MRLKSFLLIAFLFLSGFSTKLQAGHIIGGSITWECTAGGQYIFNLSLYRDCSGSNITPGTQFINGPMGTIACQFVTFRNISNQCNVPPNGCIIEEGIYRSAPISLSGIPPVSGWEFSLTICCRTTYENGTGTGFHLRAKMYPYTPVDSSQALNASLCYDSSPEFGQTAAMEVCDGPYYFNHQAMDRDMDSLSISFADVLENAQTAATFNSTYSVQAPFPDSTENPLNSAVSLDPRSGDLQIETYGASPGFYMNVIKTEAWRNGQKIAETFKELPLVRLDSLNCSTNNNNAPLVFIDTANNPNIQRNGNTYRLVAMNNDSLNLQVIAQDFDFNGNGVPQTFCVTANGIKLNPSNPSLDTGCIGGAPCATLSPSTSSSYCGSVVEAFDFNWLVQCNLLSAGLVGRSSHIFHIKVEDNACPIPKMGNLTLIVDVFPAATAPPTLAISGATVNGDLVLNWSPSQIQAASPFIKYVFYANSGPGTPFYEVDSVFNRNQTQLTLTGLAFPAEVYMNQVTGSCSQASANSDTLLTSTLLGLKDASTFPFRIYPQPARDVLKIQAPEAKGEVHKAQLLSSNGAVLAEYDLDPQADVWELDLNQAPGIYILRLEGNGQYYHHKIILH